MIRCGMLLRSCYSQLEESQLALYDEFIDFNPRSFMHYEATMIPNRTMPQSEALNQNNFPLSINKRFAE